MVSSVRRDRTVKRRVASKGTAALERLIPLERKIGDHRLSFDLFTSRRMSVVRPTGTGAELVVRAIVARIGFRFTLKNRDLPGSPDLANRSRKWAIFVHGCFWHAHTGCSKATLPKRNRLYWIAKFATNRKRDAHAVRELRKLGYTVVKVWQCELSPERIGSVERRLRARLVQSSDKPQA